jgi:hypothetical protein
MHMDDQISLYSCDLYGWVDMCRFSSDIFADPLVPANFFQVMQIFAVKLNANFAICRVMQIFSSSFCRCSSICKLFPGDADFCGQVERLCRILGDACRVQGL